MIFSSFKYQMSKLASAAVTVMLVAAGCQRPQIETMPQLHCQGKATIYEAVAALDEQRRGLVPLQATAQCRMEWRDAEGRVRRERFDAQVRFMPPHQLFFRGHRFGEIRFGTNEDEFWLRIKPELDTYWYGTRELAQECSHVLMMNPVNLTEALGLVEIDAQWELFHRDGWDLLTQRDNGRPVKRVYVDGCDYRVRRIEYYDRFGEISAATDLADYTTVADGVAIPTSIRLATIYRGLEESSAQINLQNIRQFEPTPTQARNLFERPGRDGYGTLLKLDQRCNFVEVD